MKFSNGTFLRLLSVGSTATVPLVTDVTLSHVTASAPDAFDEPAGAADCPDVPRLRPAPSAKARFFRQGPLLLLRPAPSAKARSFG